MAKVNYGKRLLAELKKHYKTNEIDEFNWYPDVDEDTYYAFVFKDNKGRKRQLKIGKESGRFSFR